MKQENILTTAVIILFIAVIVLGFTALTTNNNLQTANYNLELARAVNVKFMKEGCYIQRMEKKGVYDGMTVETYNQLK